MKYSINLQTWFSRKRRLWRENFVLSHRHVFTRRITSRIVRRTPCIYIVFLFSHSYNASFDLFRNNLYASRLALCSNLRLNKPHSRECILIKQNCSWRRARRNRVATATKVDSIICLSARTNYPHLSLREYIYFEVTSWRNASVYLPFVPCTYILERRTRLCSLRAH